MQMQEDQIRAWCEGQKPGFLLPIVLFENGLKRVIFPVCQATELGDSPPGWSYSVKKPSPFSIVARTQIPLLPAWAITIHKSQGMTLEKAVVNLEMVFEPQMAYVALSRVRSLNRLQLVSGVPLEVLQEQGRLGGENEAVRDFMEECFGDEDMEQLVDGPLEGAKDSRS